MKLEISSGSERFEIEVLGHSGQKRVWLGDTEFPCDWIRLPDGQCSLILDGCVYDLSIDLDTDSCRITGRRGIHRFQISDSRRVRGQHDVQKGQTGLQRVCAEMPGKVVRLLVRPGAEVACDQGLLVLEAMKMQNEIRAPKNGVVRDIGVRDGQAVNTGDFLLSLE